jgi:hypothetical protein
LLYPADPTYVLGKHVIETTFRRPFRRKETWATRDVLMAGIEADPVVRHVACPRARPHPAGDEGPGPFLEGGDLIMIGPRDGEHDDRYEFEFDPCGSGGRALRGDIVEGTPSRIQDPYGFGVIEGAYEWTDGKAGMCVYCNHGQQLYEHWTIDRSGIPFLIVDPPTAADGVGHDAPRRCRYTIYKQVESVPEVFERCRRSRGAP